MKYALFKRRNVGPAHYFTPGRIIELEGDVRNESQTNSYIFYLARKHKTSDDTGTLEPYGTEIFTSYIGKDIHYYGDNELAKTHMYLDSNHLHVFNSKSEIANHVLRTPLS